MAEREQRCETCRFYDPAPGYAESGECRRNPPRIIETILAASIRGQFQDGGEPLIELEGYQELEYATRWPVNHVDDWCGEWQLARTDAEKAAEIERLIGGPLRVFGHAKQAEPQDEAPEKSTPEARYIGHMLLGRRLLIEVDGSETERRQIAKEAAAFLEEMTRRAFLRRSLFDPD